MCQRTIYTHFHIIAVVSNDELDPSIFISMDGMLARWYGGTLGWDVEIVVPTYQLSLHV